MNRVRMIEMVETDGVIGVNDKHDSYMYKDVDSVIKVRYPLGIVIKAEDTCLIRGWEVVDTIDNKLKKMLGI